jgi:hypothetical protein
VIPGILCMSLMFSCSRVGYGRVTDMGCSTLPGTITALEFLMPRRPRLLIGVGTLAVVFLGSHLLLDFRQVMVLLLNPMGTQHDVLVCANASTVLNS